MATATPTKMSMQTPTDLFVHELSDIYSAEQIIVQMLGEAQGLVQDQQLAEGLRLHQLQSQQHVQRLEQIFQLLGAQPHPVTCHAAVGLRQSLMDVVQSGPAAFVLEGAVVGGACKTEHLEIAAYNGLITKAQAMGQSRIVDLLQQNLQEEQQTLEKVEMIGQRFAEQGAQLAATR
jgi:ferritin-like metal-binding protein YciE